MLEVVVAEVVAVVVGGGEGGGGGGGGGGGEGGAGVGGAAAAAAAVNMQGTDVSGKPTRVFTLGWQKGPRHVSETGIFQGKYG